MVSLLSCDKGCDDVSGYKSSKPGLDDGWVIY
jgi:hypothetical protein